MVPFRVPRSAIVVAGVGLLQGLIVFVSWVATIWSIAIVVRGFSWLYARVIVSRADITFGFAAKDAIASSEVLQPEVGERFSIQLGEGEVFYGRRNRAPTNAPGNKRFPFRQGGLVPRLRHGLVCVNKITGSSTLEKVTFTAARGVRLVALELQQGQQITVEMSRVSGFSSGIRFKGSINLNLCVLALGKALRTTASGKGILLLETTGPPDVDFKAEEAPSTAPEKLVAWSADAHFTVQASSGFINYYLSGCYLKPVSGNLFVSEAASRIELSTRMRLWKMMKSVLSPIPF